MSVNSFIEPFRSQAFSSYGYKYFLLKYLWRIKRYEIKISKVFFLGTSPTWIDLISLFAYLIVKLLRKSDDFTALGQHNLAFSERRKCHRIIKRILFVVLAPQYLKTLATDLIHLANKVWWNVNLLTMSLLYCGKFFLRPCKPGLF